MGAPSHRRRLAAGLALGCALGAALSYGMARGDRREAAAVREERLGVVAAQALAAIAGRAWDLADQDPEARARLQGALEAWQRGAPGVQAARVVAGSGARIEASTWPGDEGERAVPRRLQRDEKPVFDQAQRLRAAVNENRAEGAPRPEVELARLEGGAVEVAVPVESAGDVVGAVFVRSAAPPEAGAGGIGAGLALLAAVLPVLLFLAAARPLGERRGALAAAALALLAAGLLAQGAWSVRALGEARRAAERSIAERAAAHARAADEALASARLAGAAGPVDPARLDVDLYRAPRGAEGPEGEARLEAAVAARRGEAVRALALAGVLAAGLLLFVGLGGAARLRRTLVQHRQAYLYISPAVFGMVLLVFFPFLYGIAISFTDQTLYTTSKPLTEIWVGLDNYWKIISDWRFLQRGEDGSVVFTYGNFYYTLLFTIFWTVTNVTFGVTVGLALALALNTKGLALRPVYRVLLILPWAVPNYITALIWRGFFHQQFGVVNQAIQMFGGTPIAWYDSPGTSFFTAFATNGWLSFPFMMVVSLGALQSIPADIYEAARVDGASRWQQFRAITLPSLKPALVPAVILSVVWTFNMFNIIYLVTAGDPGGSTEILVTQAYKYAFERYQYGYAAAYSTIIFGILLLYGVFQNKVSKGTEAA